MEYLEIDVQIDFLYVQFEHIDAVAVAIVHLNSLLGRKDLRSESEKFIKINYFLVFFFLNKKIKATTKQKQNE